LSATGCAQAGNAVKKAYAFSKPLSYGKPLRDLEGNFVDRKADTSYFIYLETSSKQVFKIIAVFLGNKKLDFTLQEESSKKVSVGFKQDGKEVLLSASDKTKLVKIDLTVNAAEKTLKSFFIKGLIGTKPFQLTSTQVIELVADIRP
jgi:hypothetical protein